MDTDDTPVPEDDAIASSARHALGALASSGSTGGHSWAGVQARARRTQRRRMATVGTACAIVLLGAGAAVAATAHDGDSHLNVAAGDEPTTTAAAADSTTSTPGIDNSSSAPPNTFRGGPSSTSAGGLDGSSTTVPPADAAPQLGDVTGTITVDTPEVHAMPLGVSIFVDTNITNVSDHAIWAASVPTSYATVCRTESSDPSSSLWWMTNILLSPGDRVGRPGRFTPTAAYVGKVECELDLVQAVDAGTTFDTSAGGDEAHAVVVGRVPGVPLVTFAVYAPPTTTGGADTTTTYGVPTTTIVAP